MIEMTLAMADKAARTALEKARALGTPMTVSVVDEAGRLVLTMRGDGAGFLTPESSRAKAVAAAAYRQPTAKLAELHKTNVFWSAVPALSGGMALPTGGAVPVTIEGRVIGAIGCGGGTPEQDHECATAGAEAVAGKR